MTRFPKHAAGAEGSMYTTVKRWRGLAGLLVLFVGAVMPWSVAGQPVPAPADVFGFEPGADYKLADYGQVVAYLQRLDAASERVQMTQIGESVLGQPLLLLFVSSEANLAELDRWRGISAALALGLIDEAQARQYAREGKAVVWIDGGLHASELAAGQMTPELA
jgi:hypothetical protein